MAVSRVIFICLYGLNLSLLNCYNSYFIPSFAPFICNSIWITAALLLKDQPPNAAMSALSQWVIIGFLGQWVWTLPLTLKYTWRPWKERQGWGWGFSIPRKSSSWCTLLALGAIGVGWCRLMHLPCFFCKCADVCGPVASLGILFY